MYDSYTEILTEDGWRRFSHWKGERVGTVKLETGEFEYQTVLGRLRVYDYNGDLVLFSGAAHNVCVTPDHKMIIEPPSGNTWVREQADKTELRSRCRLLAAFPKVQGQGLPRMVIGDHDFDGDTFLEFLGHFTADGSTTRYREGRENLIKLAVKKPRKIAAFNRWHGEVVNAGVSASVCEDARGYTIYSLHSAALRWWLRIRVGTYAHNKRLPHWALNLPRDQSLVLMLALCEGDAAHVTTGGRNSFTYSTVSKQLAEQVQLLALRCAWRATLGDDGRGCYYVSMVPGKAFVALSNSKRKKVPAVARRVSYTGQVYALEVNNSALVTRRNRRVSIQGDS